MSQIYPSGKDWRQKRSGVVVRAIDCRLEGAPQAEPICRVLPTILEPGQAPAPGLAALYQERGEIETALGEFKTHLRGPRIVLRS